jgi:hypothetical protein
MRLDPRGVTNVMTRATSHTITGTHILTPQRAPEGIWITTCLAECRTRWRGPAVDASFLSITRVASLIHPLPTGLPDRG